MENVHQGLAPRIAAQSLAVPDQKGDHRTMPGDAGAAGSPGDTTKADPARDTHVKRSLFRRSRNRQKAGANASDVHAVDKAATCGTGKRLLRCGGGGPLTAMFRRWYQKKESPLSSARCRVGDHRGEPLKMSTLVQEAACGTSETQSDLGTKASATRPSGTSESSGARRSSNWLSKCGFLRPLKGLGSFFRRCRRNDTGPAPHIAEKIPFSFRQNKRHKLNHRQQAVTQSLRAFARKRGFLYYTHFSGPDTGPSAPTIPLVTPGTFSALRRFISNERLQQQAQNQTTLVISLSNLHTDTEAQETPVLTQNPEIPRDSRDSRTEDQHSAHHLPLRKRKRSRDTVNTTDDTTPQKKRLDVLPLQHCRLPSCNFEPAGGTPETGSSYELTPSNSAQPSFDRSSANVKVLCLQPNPPQNADREEPESDANKDEGLRLSASNDATDTGSLSARVSASMIAFLRKEYTHVVQTGNSNLMHQINTPQCIQEEKERTDENTTPQFSNRALKNICSCSFDATEANYAPTNHLSFCSPSTFSSTRLPLTRASDTTVNTPDLTSTRSGDLRHEGSTEVGGAPFFSAPSSASVSPSSISTERHLSHTGPEEPCMDDCTPRISAALWRTPSLTCSSRCSSCEDETQELKNAEHTLLSPRPRRRTIFLPPLGLENLNACLLKTNSARGPPGSQQCETRGMSVRARRPQFSHRGDNEKGAASPLDFAMWTARKSEVALSGRKRLPAAPEPRRDYAPLTERPSRRQSRPLSPLRLSRFSVVSCSRPALTWRQRTDTLDTSRSRVSVAHPLCSHPEKSVRIPQTARAVFHGQR